jgi:zinc protease
MNYRLHRVAGWLAAPLAALLTLATTLPAVAPAPAMAQQGFDAPPEPGPARPLQVPDFAQLKLPNGLGLVVVERRHLPLVTALLLVQAGSLQDPPGKAGLAALSYTLLAKGARRGDETVDAADISFAAESLGSSLEVSTGPQAGRLALTLPSNQLDDGLALLADVARTPTLPAPELLRSRSQMGDALTLNLSDPGLLAAQLAKRLYWGAAPAGQLATPATLLRVKREDLLNFHRQHLRPERVTLVLAGDIDLAQAKALAEKHFGDWRGGRLAPPATTTTATAMAMATRAAQPLNTSALLVDLPGAGQSAVLVLAPFAAQDNGSAQQPEQQAGALANTVLGGGYSARINQQVRINRGLSYGAASSTEALPAGGLLTASAQTKHQSVAEVAALLRAEILRLAAQEVGPRELAARKAAMVGDFGRQLESTATLAALAADQLQRRRELTELAQLPADWLAVDAPQVRRFAAQYWPESALRTVIVGDLNAAGTRLRQQFPDAWVIPADQLDLASPNLRRGGK